MPARGSSAIPCLLYENAPAAIEWLKMAFGFEPKLVVPGEGGRIDHAELVLGDIMIMLASPNDRDFGRHVIQPRDAGGKITQGPYLVVANPDAIYQRATAAGADMLVPIRDEMHGGRSFSCRDLEGHIWSFGSYNPWQS